MIASWHAVYTKARHEKTVTRRLRGSSIETFLPLVPRMSRWSDRRKLVAFPLFPGYLFVCVTPDRWTEVLQTRGVVRLLGGAASQPWVVSEDTVAALRLMVTSDVPVDPYPYLRAGRPVRVTRGPLKGLEGVLESRKGTLRVVVLVPVLGRSASAEVNAEDIEVN
ncbi:MAG: UpxY family transcription antiterminator [Planctomycetota bacterium]